MRLPLISTGMTAEHTDKVQMWDPLLRLTHWSLGGFFLLAWWLENDWPGMHSHAGYTVLLLVAFRLLWGFIGSRHARFADFLPRPAVLISYSRGLRPGMLRAPGHDPLGAVMILLLLGSLLLTTLSGISLFAMEGSGPLAGSFVADLPGAAMLTAHRFLTDLTLILVLLHVAGVLAMSMLHRENLVLAMITGRRGAADGKSS